MRVAGEEAQVCRGDDVCMYASVPAEMCCSVSYMPY